MSNDSTLLMMQIGKYTVVEFQTASLMDPVELESTLDHIAGVVTNGLFARRGADVLLLGTTEGVKTMTA